MRRIIIFTALVAALAFAPRAEAQRTMHGQFFIEGAGYVGVPFSQNIFGGEVFMGQYFTEFYWYAGAQFYPPVRRGFGSATANAGAMYRFISTRNRAFAVYIGGGALVGVDYNNGRAAIDDIIDDSTGRSSSGTVPETEDEDSIFTPDELYGTSSTGLVYGLEPRVTFEVYPFRKVGLVFGVSAPIKFKTQQSKISAKPFIGLRYCF